MILTAVSMSYTVGKLNGQDAVSHLAAVLPPPKSAYSKTIAQCQATTQKGIQCTRPAHAGGLFCWQHLHLEKLLPPMTLEDYNRRNNIQPPPPPRPWPFKEHDLIDDDEVPDGVDVSEYIKAKRHAAADAADGI